MPIPEKIAQMFFDGKVSDVHVNVGRKVDGQYVDGDLEGEHVLRQFDINTLRGLSLHQIGLRTHYSTVGDIGQETNFIPSVSVNWLGVRPDWIEQQLHQYSHPHPIIWFQSFRDPYHKSVVDAGYKRAISAGGVERLTVTHTDENGKLSKDTLAVLEIARDRRAVVATPHSNWERTAPLIIEAIRMGLSVLWVHPDSRLIQTPISVQKAIAELGNGKVFVERAAAFLRDGRKWSYSADKIVSDVRTIGTEHIIFSSDLGRLNEKDPLLPDEGIKWYIEQLLETGLTLEEAELGLVINPNKLFES